MNALAAFKTWPEVVDAATRGDPLWYHAPLDVRPVLIRVAKVYKNGKIRIDPMSRDADQFTADPGHLSRFRRKLSPGERLRAYLSEHAEFTLECHPEDMSVRGNALASGDPDEDKRCEDEIIERLDRGDDWAWCIVEVRAVFRGVVGRATLGGCSYASEADFRAAAWRITDRDGTVHDVTEYDTMRHEAIEDLATRIEASITIFADRPWMA